MRDTLPKNPRRIENGVVNLDCVKGIGTHWTAYKKTNNIVYYFDSYGNLKPPRELIKYFRGSAIRYNQKDFQKQNDFNCGHLCLKFLLTKD